MEDTDDQYDEVFDALLESGYSAVSARSLMFAARRDGEVRDGDGLVTWDGERYAIAFVE